MKKRNLLVSLIKRELHTYFLSPSTYVGIFFFLITNTIGFLFVNKFYNYHIGSTDIRFFFTIMPLSLLLVIPSLTMGLWPKEDSETMLPVSSFQMIFSKLLATYSITVATLFVNLLLIVTISFFGNIEIATVISSTIGMFFLLLSLCAFGQLCTIAFKGKSSSFFFTALFLAIFYFNGYIANSFIFNARFFQQLFKLFSFSWSFDAFTKGIIDTRSIAFYILTTAFFLHLSCYILEKRKYGTFTTNASMRNLLHTFLSCSFLICMLIWNSQIFYQRIDITESRRFTISEYTKNIISNFNSPLSITYYISDELRNMYPHMRDVEDFLYEYTSESSNITLKITEPDTDGIKSTLSSLGIHSQNVPSLDTDVVSIAKVYSAIVFDYNGKTEVIPFVFDTTNLEYDIAGRLLSLSNTLSRSAFILIANGLSLDEDYPLLVPILENAGFSIREISKDEILQTSNLDTKTPIIVIGSSELQENHIHAIDQFMQIGGKAFLSVSPINVNLNTWQAEDTTKETYSIFSMLNSYGIEIKTQLIHDESNFTTRLLSSTGETTELSYPFFIDISPSQANLDTVLGSSFKGLSMFWPSPILVTAKNNVSNELLYTSANSWLQEKNTVLENQGLSSFITNPFFEDNNRPSLNGQAEYTVSASYSNFLIVVSDQYFLSRVTSYINQAYTMRNFDYLINSLLSLQGDNDLIHLKSKSYSDFSFNKIENEGEFYKANIYSVVFLFLTYSICGFLPLILLHYRRLKLRQRFKN